MLSDTQYAYYQKTSYVYYKVFSILYKSFFLDKQGNPLFDKNGKPTNMVARALEEADEHVIQSGNAHAGKPIPWDIQTAQSQKDAGLIAGANGRSFTLNADMTNGVDASGNIIPYSETDVPATDKDGQATTKPVETSTLLKNAVDATSTISSDDLGSSITDSSEINNAQKVIQDTVNYAYVHEEAVAIPAYEAGYAAVQRALHPIVKTGESPVGDPTADTYRYENTSTVTDKLTPVLTTTNPDGSTVWTVHYSNADATNAVITIKRNANPKAPDLGQITSVQIEIDNARTGNQVANDGGSMAAIGQDSSGQVDYTSKLASATALGNGVLVTYPSMQINNNAKDASKFTKLVVIDNGDGSFSYQFIRDAQSEITTAVTGDQTTKDGTSAGNVYQAGWDYRKSYVSEITLVQRVAKTDYNGVKDTSDNTTNRVVPDQTYAGFFGNGIVGGNQSFLQVAPNAVYGKDYNTVSQSVTLLGKSTAAIQIDATGKLTYTVTDINGKQSATQATGTLNPGDSAVTIQNQETPSDQLKPGYKNSAVVITYAKDGSVNVSETGLQTVMQNSIEVDNDGSATTDTTPTPTPAPMNNRAITTALLVETGGTKLMTATAEVGKGNTTVEPDYISETLVALSDLNHKGVIFSPDTKTGKDGVSSVYNDTKQTNTNGLVFQGTTPNVPDDKQTPDTYKGTATNTTTTIQYVASNVENEKTGVTANVGTDAKGGAKVVINLNGQSTSVAKETPDTKDADGKTIPGLKVNDTNTGSEIFDWSGWYTAHQTDLNKAGWTYDAQSNQLTYDPTDTASQHTLRQQLYGNGFNPNWVSDEIGQVTSLKDQYGDVMHLSVNKQQPNRQTVEKTVNPATVLNSDGQSFKITTADITKAAKDESTPGLTVEQLKTFANGNSRSFTTGQVTLPDGFKSITVNADGSITVVLKPDVKAGTVTRALPLSFITDDASTDGNVLNTTGKDADDKPVSSLTLNLTLQSADEIKYYLKGTTTPVPGSETLAKSTTPGVVGGTYSETAPTISGYTLTSDKTVSGTYGSTPTDVIFYYKADASTVTVNYYVKGTTTKITDSKTLNGNVGDSYTSQAATVTGYTLVATPTNASGTYAAGGSTVDYYYTVDYKAVPVTPAGTPITGVTPPTGTGTPGEPVSPKGGLPTIPGYTVTKTPNIPDKPGNVNVVYTPQTETVVVNYYLQGTTTPITNSVTLSGPFGSSYQAVPANVAGYTLVATPSNASGTYGVTNGAVNYYYVENVTVVPVDQHGHTLPNVPVKQVTGVPGQQVPVSELPQVPGYTPVVTVVTIPGKPAQVEVTYVPVTVPTETTKPVEPQQPSAPQPVATPIKVAMPETITPQKTAPAVVHAVTKVTQPVQKSQSASETDKPVTLPHTGERDSLLMAIAGISLMVSGFIFIGVRKYRQN
ncbi:MucBP domain-containing protein [Furfurilactobacillus cerevisiae]|uniref:MucBP domain-containing protein n=1 Tax=Furfurilactobacillus rossiae TaxID=231049 RepID=UPI003B982D32